MISVLMFFDPLYATTMYMLKGCFNAKKSEKKYFPQKQTIFSAPCIGL